MIKISEAIVFKIKNAYQFTETPVLSKNGSLKIGYGHSTNNKNSRITKEEANEFFEKDITVIESFISKNIPIQHTQSVIDLLSVLIYEVGLKKIKNFIIYKILANPKYENKLHILTDLSLLNSDILNTYYKFSIPVNILDAAIIELTLTKQLSNRIKDIAKFLLNVINTQK